MEGDTVAPLEMPTHCAFIEDVQSLKRMDENISWLVISYVAVSKESFWAKSVDILLFPSPTSYMSTSFSFPLLNWDTLSKFL